MKAHEILRIVAACEFRTMTALDFDAFAGTENANAMIGETFWGTIILDGDKICLINDEGEESQFLLGENVFA
jgi:hypothetical protein